MAAPLTGFETDGNWTTLDHETAFLTQVAAETGAALTVAGTSGEGRPIHRVDLGAGTTQTMLVVSLQHGNEPASREAVLAQIRDVAYSTDPAITQYLATHRVVWVPNVSPDAFIRNQRANADGLDPNRDYFRLITPEARTVLGVVADVRPHLIVDAHEYWADGPDWWGFPGGGIAPHPDIAALEQAAFQACLDALTAQGRTVGQYPRGSIPRAGFSHSASAHHAAGFLSETNAYHDPEGRVAVQRAVLDFVREWHEAHAAECTAARNASRRRALFTTETYPLYTTEYIGSTPVDLNVSGYQLAAGADLPQRHVDAFGITVQSDGLVRMNQSAWAAIPHLLDPASMDVQAEATRVPRPATASLPRTSLVGLRVGVGGYSRPVVSVKHRAGGITRYLR